MAPQQDWVALFKAVLPWFVFFRAVYAISFPISKFLVKSYDDLKPGDKSLWGSAWCSSLLGLWMPYLTFIEGQANGGKLLFFDYTLDFTSPTIEFMGHVMLGYFIADLIPCLEHRQGWGKDWYVFAFHHVAAIWYFWACIWYEVGRGTLLTVCLVEFSNLFNNNRLFMSKVIVKNGKNISQEYPLINLFNGLCFTVSFIVLRIFGMTHQGWWSIVANATELHTYPLGFNLAIHSNFVIGISLQFYWVNKIISGFASLLKKTTGVDKKKA